MMVVTYHEKSKNAAILRKTEGRCWYCGITVSLRRYPPGRQDPNAFSADHVVPTRKGGTNELSNLVPACITCNVSKGKKTLEEWRDTLEWFGIPLVSANKREQLLRFGIKLPPRPEEPPRRILFFGEMMLPMARTK